MNTPQSLQINFEKAARLLSLHTPPSDLSTKKPVLFHGLRVGVYLYEQKYKEEVVIAGVLHDILEDTDITEEELEDSFGDEVLRLVQASTKDDSIKDGLEKTEELIKRCAVNGEDALIVKAADILDSFKWYDSQNNNGEIAYCMRNANAILEHKPEQFKDKIFDELRGWRDRFSVEESVTNL